MKKTIIIVGVVIIVMLAGGYFYLNSGGIEAELYEVKQGEFREYIEVTGKVEIEEKDKIFSKLDGIIKEIYVKEGDVVSKGAKLAEGDAEDFV